MKAIDRYETYKDINLSVVLTDIKNGKINTGKYYDLVKRKGNNNDLSNRERK